MDPTDLTLAILREIRDNTAKTNDRLDHLTGRVDHLTDRVDAQGAQLDTMAAVQIRQAQQLTEITGILREHSERFDRHEEALLALVRETRRIHDRIDHVYDGPLSTTVRDHEARIRRLEGRND
jgi:uncharacterized coiled-coil protein SlyX